MVTPHQNHPVTTSISPQESRLHKIENLRPDSTLHDKHAIIHVCEERSVKVDGCQKCILSTVKNIQRFIKDKRTFVTLLYSLHLQYVKEKVHHTFHTRLSLLRQEV